MVRDIMDSMAYLPAMVLTLVLVSTLESWLLIFIRLVYIALCWNLPHLCSKHRMQDQSHTHMYFGSFSNYCRIMDLLWKESQYAGDRYWLWLDQLVDHNWCLH